MNRRDKEARKKRRREERARSARAPTRPQQAAPLLSPEDQVMAAVGFDVEAFVREGAREAAAAVVADRTQAGVEEAVARVDAAAARELRRYLTVLPPSKPIACGAGCAHCCWLRAEASALEVLRIADHLRSTLPAKQLEDVCARVLETARRVVGLGTDARAEAAVPCALLLGDRCTVYEVRPLACRGCNAADPEACEASLSDGEVTNVVYAPQSALYRYAGRALVRALDALGAPQALMELNAALAVALSTPDVTSRWMRGEPIFRDVDESPLLRASAGA
jgi:Fe-S-cluster containining protein